MATLPPLRSPAAAGAPMGTPRFKVQIAHHEKVETPAKMLMLGPPYAGKTKLLCSWNLCSYTPPDPGLFIVVWDTKLEMIHAHPGIPFVTPESPAQFRNEILPWMLQGGLAKDYPSVRAIGVDTLSSWNRALKAEAVADGGTKWGQLYDSRIHSDLGQLTRLTLPNNGLPRQYHLVVTCHEKDKWTGPQDNRVLSGTEPALYGDFSNTVSGYFDITLYPTREEVSEPVQVEGATQYQRKIKYQVRALPPVGHRAPAGGMLWGTVLPPTVEDATYLGLRKLCGLGELAPPPQVEGGGATNDTEK
jgi:hypothetical protein